MESRRGSDIPGVKDLRGVGKPVVEIIDLKSGYT